MRDTIWLVRDPNGHVIGASAERTTERDGVHYSDSPHAALVNACGEYATADAFFALRKDVENAHADRYEAYGYTLTRERVAPSPVAVGDVGTVGDIIAQAVADTHPAQFQRNAVVDRLASDVLYLRHQLLAAQSAPSPVAVGKVFESAWQDGVMLSASDWLREEAQAFADIAGTDNDDSRSDVMRKIADMIEAPSPVPAITPIDRWVVVDKSGTVVRGTYRDTEAEATRSAEVCDQQRRLFAPHRAMRLGLLSAQSAPSPVPAITEKHLTAARVLSMTDADGIWCDQSDGILSLYAIDDDGRTYSLELQPFLAALAAPSVDTVKSLHDAAMQAADRRDFYAGLMLEVRALLRAHELGEQVSTPTRYVLAKSVQGFAGDIVAQEAADPAQSPVPAEKDGVCELCGEPMPAGEEMFKFHGYSGPCPSPTRQLEGEG